MEGFRHETLGPMDDEERWLKFFPRKEFKMLIAGGGTGLAMMRILPQNGFFILLEIVVVLFTLWRVCMGMITKSPSKYLNGGGVTRYELLIRKLKRKPALYVLGIKEEI